VHRALFGGGTPPAQFLADGPEAASARKARPAANGAKSKRS
jgi:hypothetical protein